MELSVVLSTYNAPELLHKTLLGYARQDVGTFELVIADDGSGPETAALVEALREQTGLDLRHVWHEDRGFRKCAILNRAIEAARGEYLVFSDGDCIPWPGFLRTHLGLAHRARFLSGGYFMMPREVSEAISLDDVRAGRHEDLGWLFSRGLPRRWKARRLGVGPGVARLLDLLTPTRATWNGHNASAYKEDLLRVNGFDERMGWGGEDRELGERLVHLGRRGRQIRHRSVCLHQWHERGYVKPEMLTENRRIRRETARTRAVYTPHGIVKADEATA